MKPVRSSAVQIARIAALTTVAVAFILGSFMLASSYVTATLACDYQPYTHQEMLEERPTFQQLVDPLESEESKQESKHEPAPDQQQPLSIKLPLQLDFDDIAGAMMEKNMRSRMNCVVEKRRAEEVMDHQPKTVRLPFGVNLTTDPRYEHVTGERMAIFCESGNDQREVPREQTMTPVMVPIPVPHHVAMMPHQPVTQPMAAHQVPHQEHYQMPHQVAASMVVSQSQPSPRVLLHHQRMIRPDDIPLQIVREVIPILEENDARLQDLQVEARPVHLPERFPGPVAEGRAMHVPHPLERVQVPHILERVQMAHHLPIPHPLERAIHQEIHPEARALPVPSDTVKPPPPPFGVHPESARPHFVQPRSVRSVDEVLHRRDKRVRRCACDCAC